MANFRQRLKQDKKFRLQMLVIGGIIFALLISGGGDKKQGPPFADAATCQAIEDSIESGDPLSSVHTWEDDDISRCISANCVYLLEGVFGDFCKAGLDNGDRVQQSADYVQQWGDVYPDSMCKSDCVKEDEEFIDEYICRSIGFCETTGTPTGASKSCNELEKGVASIVQGVGLFEDNCKSAYYMAIVGGIFLLFMLLAVI